MRGMQDAALAAACKVVKGYEDAIGRPASRRAVGADGFLNAGVELEIGDGTAHGRVLSV